MRFISNNSDKWRNQRQETPVYQSNLPADMFPTCNPTPHKLSLSICMNRVKKTSVSRASLLADFLTGIFFLTIDNWPHPRQETSVYQSNMLADFLTNSLAT
jgi:hypothetical protein